MVPMALLELGPSGTTEVDNNNNNEVSNSSSDERTRSISPPHNNDNGKSEIVREESPDSDIQPQGWGSGPNKLQKINPSNSMDQSPSNTAEATMRKARVSVRARSEAPMVCIN